MSGDKAPVELLHFWPVHRSLPSIDLRPGGTGFRERLASRLRSPNSVVFSQSRITENPGSLQSGEDRFTLGVIDLLAAKIVGAPLHVADFERVVEEVLEQRNVFKEELLLKVLRSSGNDNSLPERMAGRRYASVLPVPVPASTMRCLRCSVKADSTASAISA